MPDRILSDTLHRLMHAYRHLMRSAIREQGIELPITHIRVLKGVHQSPECSAHSIALKMHRDKAQIARVINELTRDGLISKHPDPDDGRRLQLRPTEKGEALKAILDQVEQQITAQLTAKLPREDIEHFVRISDLICEQSSSQPTGS